MARKHSSGTISCIALDNSLDISGVTTTRGLAWKIPGRVGDSPLIGCGLYVDNEVGAAGSTGRGDDCSYIKGGRTVIEYTKRGASPEQECLDALKLIAARYGNDLGRLEDIDVNFYAPTRKASSPERRSGAGRSLAAVRCVAGSSMPRPTLAKGDSSRVPIFSSDGLEEGARAS